MPRCIIFANGILPDLAAARRLIRPDDLILAADGGTRHALDLGLTPSIVIGDLDSISDEERRKMKEDGVRLIQHPRDKNETDLELALDYAIQNGQRKIVIVAALGGRLDQTLGNLALLTDPRHKPALSEVEGSLDTRLDDGVEQTFFCRDRSEVEGRRGDLVSLIPWGGEVRGVRTQGLRWQLSDEVLLPHKTRGISNEMTGEVANIQIQSGLLLIVHRRLITNH
ncbi:MAG: thiamine diphosphokinase [Anaerolineae bacterium CG1_02_58_13]|nr:MAG: thiamine diphosphokinase [Anaerolineae bacterium CG1_02_58_13]